MEKYYILLIKYLLIKMEDTTFKIKNLEFHLKEMSFNYDKCVSKAIKAFLDNDADFNTHFKPCENLKTNLNDLMKKYEELNAERP